MEPILYLKETHKWYNWIYYYEICGDNIKALREDNYICTLYDFVNPHISADLVDILYIPKQFNYDILTQKEYFVDIL
jgi:hypothetical protein